MKKNIKLAVIGVITSILTCSGIVYARSLIDMSVFRTNNQNALDAKKVVWQTYYENDWTGLITNFGAPERNTGNYAYLLDYDQLVYDDIVVALVQKKGDWEDEEADYSYVKILTAVAKALGETYPDMHRVPYNNERPVLEQVYSFDICNVRTLFGEDVVLYDEGLNQNNIELMSEIKGNSVRLLFNKMKKTQDYFDYLIAANHKEDIYSNINIMNSDNPGFKIFVQGILYGKNYMKYCVENELMYEDENAQNWGDFTAGEKDFANKVCENYKTVQISYVSPD